MAGKPVNLIVTVVLLLVLCAPASAHHGGAAYERNKPVTFKATVTDYKFVNPHVQIYFDVADDKGSAQHWGCESVNPGMLAKQGWTRHMMKPGDQVTIIGYPSKTGSNICLIDKLILADGHEFTGKLLN